MKPDRSRTSSLGGDASYHSNTPSKLPPQSPSPHFAAQPKAQGQLSRQHAAPACQPPAPPCRALPQHAFQHVQYAPVSDSAAQSRAPTPAFRCMQDQPRATSQHTLYHLMASSHKQAQSSSMLHSRSKHHVRASNPGLWAMRSPISTPDQLLQRLQGQNAATASCEGGLQAACGSAVSPGMGAMTA